MRALAAKQITHDQHGNEIVMTLVDAYILPIKLTRLNMERDKFVRAGSQYDAMIGSTAIGTFSSLHCAKNAIRRHFGIESRKMLRWEEIAR